MKLLVDNREPKDIINILNSRVKHVELANLDIGDFIIKTDLDEIIMIFERKSLADLVASVKDGRYNEQSFRLSEYPLNNHNIYYIIEGNTMNFCNRNSEPIQKMIFSSMLSLSYKKGFSLLHTSSSVETCEFIIRFMEKLELEKINIGDTINQSVNYSNIIKVSKKSNITSENIGEIMLSQIPGVSMVVAQTIFQNYKTMTNLISSLREDSKSLDNILIEYKNGQRKISTTIKKNILEFLGINM
jgi:ERCC4-type nuclease